MNTSPRSAFSLPMNSGADAQFLVWVNTKAEVDAALDMDIVRLGGKKTARGYRFHTRSGRNIAARVLQQRWGKESIETIDGPAAEASSPTLKVVPAQKETRILIVGLGDANTRGWYENLGGREFNVRLSTNGLRCSTQLKKFQPNVLLIDEALLWGPRPNPRAHAFPPMRVALLRDDTWNQSNRLILPTGGPLPAVTGPTGLDGLLRDEFLID